ncbi:ankyrin [Tamlana nanhaiensis]|uniref:Ankyrin n=1 Tax=Neotamlana nanhaiensis TaxID=1382798 RepID=A0A0D7W3A1_9FLAO|nr:ankyrin repeat domain-containing protein [Tamlana nanhaiensis]KJD33509.1 ankyrin [Tamlana nanhaiensis]
MKKTIILSAIALSTFVSVKATPSTVNYETPAPKAYYFKVNSFCVSIAQGDLDTVQKLISRGADVNEKSNGMTPAMYAAKYNRTEILKLLIIHGADLKQKSTKKMTALEYAKLHGAKDTAAIIKEQLSKKKNKK